MAHSDPKSPPPSAVPSPDEQQIRRTRNVRSIRDRLEEARKVITRLEPMAKQEALDAAQKKLESLQAAIRDLDVALNHQTLGYSYEVLAKMLAHFVAAQLAPQQVIDLLSRRTAPNSKAAPS